MTLPSSLGVSTPTPCVTGRLNNQNDSLPTKPLGFTSPADTKLLPPFMSVRKALRLHDVVRRISSTFGAGRFSQSPKGKRGKDFLKAYLKKFDADEVEVLRKVYKELSARNSDPGIDKATFLEYFPLPGLWGERLFLRFDYKGLGVVDYEEFLVGVAVCCRGTRCERIHVLFEVFDLNNDGVLSKEELITMLSNLPNLDRYIEGNSKPNLPSVPSEGFLPLPSQVETLLQRPGSSGSSRNKSDHKDNALASTTESPVSPPYSGDNPSSFDVALDKLAEPNNVTDEKFCMPYDPEIHFEDDEDDEAADDEDDNDDIAEDIEGPSMFDEMHEGSLLASSDIIRNTFSASFSAKSLLPNHSAVASPCYSDNINLCPGECSTTPSPSFLRRSESKKLRKPSVVVETPALDQSPPVNTAPAPIPHSIDVEAFVDKIIEECEFSESDSLTFMEFKTWLEKNDTILAMFNDCLHEEAWGLQGNALDRRILNRTTKFEGRFRRFNLLGRDPKPDAVAGRGSKRGIVDIRPDAFYKVKRLFTLPTHETLLNTSALKHKSASKPNKIPSRTSSVMHSLLPGLNSRFPGDSAISLEVPVPTTTAAATAVVESKNGGNFSIYSTPEDRSVRPPNSQEDGASTIMVTGATTASAECQLYRKQTRDVLNLQLWNLIASSNPNVDIAALNNSTLGHLRDGMSNLLEDDLIACPACGSLLLVCPRCNGRFPRLRLRHGAVIVECRRCLDDKAHEFNNCWHCNWQFAKVVDHVDECEPLCEGVLYKIGRHTRKWRCRYFVLVDNLLYYFSRKEDTSPKGFIFLEGCFVQPISRVADNTGVPSSGVESCTTVSLAPTFMKRATARSNKYGFSIIHGGDKVPRRDLYAATEAERRLWINSLRNAMKQRDIEDLYIVQHLIGQGKFSVVHKSVARDTQQPVAIKFIDKCKITGQEQELLRSEIAILRLLHHPHVISFREILDTQATIHIVMEYVEGGELYDLLLQRRRLPELHVNRIIFQLLSTVAYLHECGIIHRDLKPENILLTSSATDADIKITDFGLSCICGPGELVKQPCGTLAYVAPEVLTLQGYNHKVDVWSVGVIMYLLLRGRLPFPVARPVLKQQPVSYYHRPLAFEGPIWDNVCSSAKDLLRKLLNPDSQKRISARDALQHIWLKNPTAVMISEGADLQTTPLSLPATKPRKPSTEADCHYVEEKTQSSTTATTTTVTTATASPDSPNPHLLFNPASSEEQLYDISAATFSILPPPLNATVSTSNQHRPSVNHGNLMSPLCTVTSTSTTTNVAPPTVV